MLHQRWKYFQKMQNFQLICEADNNRGAPENPNNQIMKWFYITGLVIIFSYTCSFGQVAGNPQSAEFPGGMPKFYEYQRNTMVFPKKAMKKGLKGKVYVEFYITENGSVDPQAVRMVPAREIETLMGGRYVAEMVSDESLEAEAVRIIKNSPAWKPGTLNGKPIRQKMIMPVIF